jgi:hypothetical protein
LRDNTTIDPAKLRPNEAVALKGYRRGQTELTDERECYQCWRGLGPFPKCIVAESLEGEPFWFGACSNCKSRRDQNCHLVAFYWQNRREIACDQDTVSSQGGVKGEEGEGVDEGAEGRDDAVFSGDDKEDDEEDEEDEEEDNIKEEEEEERPMGGIRRSSRRTATTEWRQGL